MPYIKEIDRQELEPELVALCDKINDMVFGDAPGGARPNDTLDGILNYCIFKMCKILYPEGYFWYNRMIGMMECCKQELYRRVVVPYEEKKIVENGDVTCEVKRPKNTFELREETSEDKFLESFIRDPDSLSEAARKYLLTLFKLYKLMNAQGTDSDEALALSAQMDDMWYDIESEYEQAEIEGVIYELNDMLDTKDEELFGTV